MQGIHSGRGDSDRDSHASPHRKIAFSHAFGYVLSTARMTANDRVANSNDDQR
jgi:hypothetical protein